MAKHLKQLRYYTNGIPRTTN